METKDLIIICNTQFTGVSHRNLFSKRAGLFKYSGSKNKYETAENKFASLFPPFTLLCGEIS